MDADQVDPKWFNETYTSYVPKDVEFVNIRTTKRGIQKIKLPQISTFSSEACCYAVTGVGPTLTANGAQSRIKMLFPDKTIRLMNSQEAYRYMGFEDSDFVAAKSVGVKDIKIIKQAGNSIPVPVLEYIFKKGVS